MAAEQIAFVPKVEDNARVWRGASRVEIYDDPRQVMPIWQELLEVAPASVYQTPSFLLPWLATRGIAAGIEPLFIVQRDGNGRALAMLALGLKRFGWFRTAVFLGAKDSNFNFGLFRPGYVPNGTAIAALLREAGRMKGAHCPDLLLLYNQPLTWNGWKNPLSALPRQWSPSFAYQAKVDDDAESFFKAHISKDTRKKLRRKERRLAQFGTLQHLTDADGNGTKLKIMEAFFRQKLARFGVQNIEAGFGSAAMRRFVEIATQPLNENGGERLELHALSCGDRIVAVYGGATHRGHFSAYFNSFDADPEIAKSSPGDLLLLKLIEAKSAADVTSFDLGIGEARYKNRVCDETIPLFDCFVPLTLKGRVLAMAFGLSLRIKRDIKQNQSTYKIVSRIRSALRHKA